MSIRLKYREKHHLPTCKCFDCTFEREMMSYRKPLRRVILTPDQARLLGFITTPKPKHGSVARDALFN